MPKPRRATEKQIPSGSELTFKAEQIETTFEDSLDRDGRFSRLGEHAGVTVYAMPDGTTKRTQNHTW